MSAITVLFLRDFRGFQGGHLRAWQYFEYLDADPRFQPVVSLTAESIEDENPWAGLPDRYHVDPDFPADVLVLGGMDWRRLDPRERTSPTRPIVNLVQGMRHTNADNPRYAFLRHPAIRVCVSPEVESAVRATGIACGPILKIDTACDVDPRFDPWEQRLVNVFIGAMKAPELGVALARRLIAPGRVVSLQTDRMPRDAYLDEVARAQVAVLLPLAEEGFFRPAVEAMALGTVVVVPDCVGNRSFCIDGTTCFVPAFDEESIAAAVEQALARGSELDGMRSAAHATAARFSPENERREVLSLMERVPRMWAELHAVSA